MISDAFDPELLRTFAAVCRHGSLSHAANHAGREQSALSTQMRRLEQIVGKPLLRRTGRGVVPTPEGQLFLGYATRILALGEEAAARVAGRQVAGTVRIGLAEDVALTALSATLGRVKRGFPDLHLEIVVDHGVALAERWREHALDVAVATCSVFTVAPVHAWDVALHWVCAIDDEPDPARPLDVIVYAEPCLWRGLMFEALARAGRDYRVTLTSQNVGAIASAVENGLGVALLTPECIRASTMKRMTACADLPTDLGVRYGIYAARPDGEAVAAVIAMLRASVSGA